MHKAYFNWSSGKDSALALYHALHGGEFAVQTLFTAVSQEHGSIFMHETGPELLARQAEALGLPLRLFPFSPHWNSDEYTAAMRAQAEELRAQGISTALYGDLWLEGQRQRREEQCRRMGLRAAFPLWGRKPAELLREFFELGFKAVLTCVDESALPREFLGETLSPELLAAFPAGADLCGENGEYHSFVFDGPVFRHPVHFRQQERFCREYPSPGGGTRRFSFLRLL